ncbi:MAG: flagellar biosynthesis anti-sigma factor FlgM [Deltaproteobacteria bacterium]|nr:flagellar biosynthesis anti-sigma factor FlgM [Deltaproteobacteria bacterium]
MKPSGRKGNEPGKGSDSRKIQEIRTAVSNGKYRVESDKVAEKIVRDAVREIRGRLK